MLLRGGLAAGVGLAAVGLGAAGLGGVAEAATRQSSTRLAKPAAIQPDLTFQTQLDWAYCDNCAVLWYTGNNTAGYCAYSRHIGEDGGHVKSPSFSYELRYNISGTGGPAYQPGWNWCHKCQSLFFANNAGESWCPDPDPTGQHASGGLAYSVLYNDAVAGSSQPNWWWCGQCQGLFYAPGGSGGWCPATAYDDASHQAGQGSTKSDAYDVSYYSTNSP